jgi:hypothetical protein
MADVIAGLGQSPAVIRQKDQTQHVHVHAMLINTIIIIIVVILLTTIAAVVGAAAVAAPPPSPHHIAPVIVQSRQEQFQPVDLG